MTQPTKRKNPTNNYAKELRTPKYKSRVIQSKKVYTRKGNKNEFNTEL